MWVEPNGSNDTATVMVDVTAQSDLLASLQSLNNGALPNQLVNFQLEVLNLGASSAENTVATIQLPRWSQLRLRNRAAHSAAQSPVH